MAWRDQLRPASFRGVKFEVDAAQLSTGRRLARHEYPQRDVPYFEDMGKKAREYKIEAFIIGRNYMAGRDQLLDAIEKAGPGQLVHPYYGELRVTVSSDCQLTESTQFGGMAKFSLTFVEAGKQQEPTSQTDTQLVLENQSSATKTAIAKDFTSSFTVKAQPDYVAQGALNSANSILGIPSMSLGELGLIRANSASPLQALLPENLAASLNNPQNFAQGILKLVSQSNNLPELFAFNIDSVDASTTPSRTVENNNRIAITNLIQQAATAQRISDLAATEVATIDDANIVRAEIVSLADTILLNEKTGQSAAEAILQLRTDAIKHFGQLTQDLPKLISIVPPAVRPVLVMANDFYGDAWLNAGRDEEIIARNKIRHPGFVPAGKPTYLLV